MARLGRGPAGDRADSAERAGDDSPGLFELGVTADLRKLQADVLKLGRSLARALDRGWRPSLCDGGGAGAAGRVPLVRDARAALFRSRCCRS